MENKDNTTKTDIVEEEKESKTKKSPGRPPKNQKAKPIQETRIKRKKMDRNEDILCRSITHGKLIYISERTGTKIIWKKHNDEEYVEFGELLTMKASQPAFLERPLIIIEDDDAIESLGLKYVYDGIINPDSIDNFFNLSLKKMENVLEKCPRGIKKLVGARAREMVESKDLFDIRIIQLLEKKLNVDLQMFLEE